MTMPSFGDVKEWNPLNKHINSTDVLVGAGIGLAGGGLVMYLQRTYWPTAPSFVSQYAGPLSAIVAGAGAYSLFRRKSRSKAQGYFAGAVAIGVVPFVYAMAKAQLPTSVTQYFGDPVSVMPSFGGLLTRSPGPYGGLLTASPGPVLASSPARRALGY